MDKPTRYYSSRQEKKVAHAVGGRKTANSGATAFQKGDVLTDMFLLECKTSTSLKNSFTLKRDWFNKNKEEAFAMGKPYSAVVFDFGDDINRYVIDEKLFRMLVEYLEEDK